MPTDFDRAKARADAHVLASQIRGLHSTYLFPDNLEDLLEDWCLQHQQEPPAQLQISLDLFVQLHRHMPLDIQPLEPGDPPPEDPEFPLEETPDEDLDGDDDSLRY